MKSRRIRRRACARAGDESVSYSLEWAAVLIVPAIFSFLLAPWLVLIALVVALIVLTVVVVALAAAIVASPYLIASFLRNRWLAMRAAGRRPALPRALKTNQARLR
jgi:hypothetical protein